jgi:hypothetical protein
MKRYASGHAPAMNAADPLVYSHDRALASSPAAAALAREVRRIHHRYANEVVGAFGLCPFFRDAESSFGHFCVMLDRELDPEAACRQAREAAGSIVHLVYPRVRALPQIFERFGNGVGQALRRESRDAPVLASFHPEMAGDPGAAHRLVGLLRRAPDPFIQLVPEGLHEGGTIFAGSEAPPRKDPSAVNFARLAGGELDKVLALLADIRADRDRSYAPHLSALEPRPSEAMSPPLDGR